ncbi:MAG: molybdopterin adenylyltransferase [Anaerolineaceae bacterium]|nr:molybdopterin adenylyltransferase [Anaerolineaceae bacterium]
MIRQITVAILTISDRSAAGSYEDQSGPVIEEIVTTQLEAQVEQKAVIPDEIDLIKTTLLQWVEQDQVDLILTTGGTGFAPRDVTPEATRLVIEKETPGLVFAMFKDSLAVTPHAMLSRMVAGIRARTLIINLPGSPKAARENLTTILPALPHAVELLRDDPLANKHHEVDQD